MAQYYQVLGQDEKHLDDQTKFYQTTIDENQTVQYVIASETQPQFQAQPVVVSSEQLMVVERQGQQVIIDQSQVSYQESSFVIQEAQDFQNNQPIYYMANTQHGQQQIVVEKPIAQARPAVLNQPLMQSQLNSKVDLGQQVQQINTASLGQKATIQMQKARQNKGQPNRQPNLTGIQMQKCNEATVHNFQTENNEDDEEIVSLADGTLVTRAHYKKLLQHQKQNQALHAKLGLQMMPGNALQRRPKLPAPQRPRVNKLPQQQQKQCINSSFNEQQYQALQQQQHVNRSIQNQQQLQHQYLIQPPRAQENKPQKPLPSFLQSSQIQTIIDNTPVNTEYSDSIRMLVLLDSGEQRLITFTLPKEACTIQEILEQVNVPFTADTPIQVNEANSNGLNYIVTVGHVPGFSMDLSAEEIPPSDPTYQQHSSQEPEQEAVDVPQSQTVEECKREETPPRFVEGKLAVCSMCGILSEDFNRCTRCKRKFPENVKAVNSPNRKVDLKSLATEKRITVPKTNGVPKMNLLQKKRPQKPTRLLECETVVVSSDDEETGERKPKTPSVNEHILEKLGAQITLSPISKEPSILDIQKNSIHSNTRAIEKIPADQVISTSIICRTVRIGSYRYVPPEPVRVDSNGITLKVPHPKQDNAIKVIKIDNSQMVKVLICFQKALPVMFYYLLPSVGSMIRTALDMAQGSDYYFDPLSDIEESHRRITFLPETMTENYKNALHKIYGKTLNILEELNYKEANDILIKTCPKELTKTVLSYGSLTEVKQILEYPPEGRGRISINTEDYICLGQDQFLNDVIIDFYLKYLVQNLPKDLQDKVHVFSTFFYKRLTTKPTKASRKSQPTELDPNLSPAEKRHARVKTWTKNVNIFEKDFIIVPINENCHWFLAIICFPNMNGCYTMDGQSVKIEPRQPKKKKTGTTAASLNTSAKEKKPEPIPCEDPDLSDKDEAEGDDSELESDDSDESSNSTLSIENNSQRPPIKQPCILIFDSLAGTSRSRVVATLRDYLTCEYKAKMNAEKIFTKDVIKGASPKIPQQTNFTDCGLYLLQYVEQFFKDPIKDYFIPISQLKTWFEEVTVTRKREEISLLIKSLMKQYGKDLNLLPDVVFPTLNGEVVERDLLGGEDNFPDPDETGEEKMEEEEGDEEYLPPSGTPNNASSVDQNDSSQNVVMCTIKPSSESIKLKNNFIELPIGTATVLKPDVSELPKQTSNKDTLNYLKAKRIIRHNKGSPSSTVNEGPDFKKIKTSADDST